MPNRPLNDRERAKTLRELEETKKEIGVLVNFQQYLEELLREGTWTSTPEVKP